MPKPTVYDLIDLLTSIAIDQPSLAPGSNIDTIRFGLLLSLAGPLGLLGNLASILSVADPWRVDAQTGQHKGDMPWVLVINSVALFFGCLSNVLLAFVRNTLWVVSLSYFFAVVLYMSLMIAVQYVYFHNTIYMRSFGYWQAVAASCFYFIATVLSGAHAVHVYRNKISAGFSPKFKRLVLLSALYIAYIAIGGAMFSARTMINLTYAECVYFAVVTCLTLGYGDIVPPTNLSRALDIPFIYGGLIMGGLVTYAIFSIGLYTARTASAVAAVERERIKLTNTFDDPEDSFIAIRDLVSNVNKWKNIRRTALTLLWLVTFWLLGALVFMFTESWTYFQAFYMCAVALASVGYGEFVPKSVGGRCFLIYWALIALPTMATTVSDIYSLIFALVTAKNVSLEKKVHKSHKHKHKHKVRYHVFDYTDSESKETWDLIYTILNAKCYGYDIWEECISNLFYPEEVPADFWVSNHSPLRNPALNERKFLLLACSHSISDFSIEKKLDH